MQIRRDIMWTAAQLASVAVMFGLFLVLVPWFAAVPVQELSAKDLALLPEHCPAATNSHGQVNCYWLGTVSSHQSLFNSLVILFVVCYGFFLFTGFTGRGISFRRPKAPRSNGA